MSGSQRHTQPGGRTDVPNGGGAHELGIPVGLKVDPGCKAPGIVVGGDAIECRRAVAQ